MRNIIIHTIKKGEKLEGIAKLYNMDLKEIIILNKIVDRNKLGIGNKLKVYEK